MVCKWCMQLLTSEIGEAVRSSRRKAITLHSLKNLLLHGRVFFSDVEKNLNYAQDYADAGRLQPVIQNVHNVQHFLIRFRFVCGNKLENSCLAPFVEVFDSIEQVNHHFGALGYSALIRKNFLQCLNGIGDHHRVLISDQLVESVNDIFVLHCNF